MDDYAEGHKEFVLNQLSNLTESELVFLLIISSEYIEAKNKHPNWPTDEIHQTAIVQEEAGEMIRAALNYKYEGARYSEIHKEAVQTAAMGLRFLVEASQRNRKPLIIDHFNGGSNE